MRKKTSTKNYCSSNWPTRCELFVVCWFLNRESVNCKLTSVHLILQCVFMSFFLRTGGWLRHYNTTDFFLDSLTAGLALIREHSCIIFFFCQDPILSYPSSSFFILSAPLWFLISFCGAVAILLHLACLLGCLLGVCDEMASGHPTKKKKNNI